jgi:hypothetical protein
MYPVNPITSTMIILFSAISCFIVGFLIRQQATNKLRKRMLELENEMLANHEEILKLETVLAKMSSESSNAKDTPIITLSNNQNQQKAAK